MDIWCMYTHEMRRCSFFFRSLVLVFLYAVGSAAVPIYNVRIISPLPGNSFVLGVAINSSGLVAGMIGNGGPTLAFVGSEPIVGPRSETQALDLNDAGQAAISSFDIGSVGSGFIWQQGVGLTALPTPDGYLSAFPIAINNQGNVVGVVDTGIPNNYQQAGVMWVNGIANMLGPGVVPFDVNSAGEYVGMGPAGDPIVGTISGGFTSLSPPGFLGLAGYSINDAGSIVGLGRLGSEVRVWVRIGSSFTIIPLLSGFTYMSADRPGSTNIHNQVVGVASDGSSGSPRGWLWDPVGGLVDLNDRVPTGWTITQAVGINNAGQILAYGTLTGGSYHTVVLDPVPEPRSSQLLLVTLAFVCWRNGRRGLLLRSSGQICARSAIARCEPGLFR